LPRFQGQEATLDAIPPNSLSICLARLPIWKKLKGMRWNTLFAIIIATSFAHATEVTIKVEGVKDNVGKVAALLFSDAAGFPNETAKAVRKIQVDAKPGTTEIKLTGLKPGRYAVCVIHDANQNALLDRNFIGIPKEGVAISNGIRREKPTFEKAVIEIKEGDTVVLPLKYW
jgi:uncharacterized protein (DUF2141 family)